MRLDILIFFLINASLISAQGIISGNWEYFSCWKFGSLESCLEKTEKRTKSLTIEDSSIPRIYSRIFEKYVSLHSLTINSCGVKKIHKDAFSGLINLERLDLSGNELTLLESSYLNNVPNLKYLDVSFNKIEAIDDLIIFNLKKLENFYFDYNKISAVSNRMLHRLQSDVIPRVNLRNVKFGKNPLNWEYQMLLTRRFDDLNINYQDDWENWSWLSKTFRDCQENEAFALSSDQSMNCVIEKLIDFADVNFNSFNIPCTAQAENVIKCFKGNLTQRQNIDGIRYALEGLGSIIRSMEYPQAKFHISPDYKTKLDYQVIRYNAGQDDWAWFEDVINVCSRGAFHEEQVLDCEVQQLLDLASSIFENSGTSSNSSSLCNIEASNLLQCSKVSPFIDDIAVRRAIQGFEMIIPQMDNSLRHLDL